MLRHMQNPKTAHVPEPGDINLIELWLRKDPTRLMAGAMAGLFAGLLSICVAGLMAKSGGSEFWFPIKVAALPVLGGSATEYGMHMKAIVLGLVIHEFISMVLGMIYSHFVATNAMPALLGGGFVWGIFSWIFIQNLFIQSFTDVFAAHLSSGAAFLPLMIFGLSLSSVAFFDRAIRK